MVHPATKRVVRAALTPLDAPLDLGFVFPPADGQDRGFGQWTNRDLGPAGIMGMLGRAAAANARGGNVYVRLGPSARDKHPGIVLLDDLGLSAVEKLTQEGFEPLLVVETSPGNHQAWIRLLRGGSVPYATMGSVARYLAREYGGDPKAISPRQPGRLPGFTNRKPKHRREDGTYPFVRLVSAEPGRTASKGETLLERLSSIGTAARRAGAAPQTLPVAAHPLTGSRREFARLDRIRGEQELRLRAEVERGKRPGAAFSQSELDFATAVAALRLGTDPGLISRWLVSLRPGKGGEYAARTVRAGESWLDIPTAPMR